MKQLVLICSFILFSAHCFAQGGSEDCIDPDTGEYICDLTTPLDGAASWLALIGLSAGLVYIRKEKGCGRS